MPEATLEAEAEHGRPHGDTYDASQELLGELTAFGISYDDVVTRLEEEGVKKFKASWNDLLAAVDSRGFAV